MIPIVASMIIALLFVFCILNCMAILIEFVENKDSTLVSTVEAHINWLIGLIRRIK